MTFSKSVKMKTIISKHRLHKPFTLKTAFSFSQTHTLTKSLFENEVELNLHYVDNGFMPVPLRI